MSNNIHDILHRLSAIEGGVRARPSKIQESEVPALLRMPVSESNSDEESGWTSSHDKQGKKIPVYIPSKEEDEDDEELNEARLEEKASEDILSQVKASFTDYLKGLEDTIKQDREILDKKKRDLDLTKKSLKDLELQAPEKVTEFDMPGDVEECSAPVKTFTLECGTECSIYGDEGNGFSIRRGERELPSRFGSVDDAEMALELFNARRAAKMNSVNDTDADYLEEK